MEPSHASQDAFLPQDARIVEPASSFLRYPGAKWSLASWILRHFPDPSAYDCYIEPFAGSAACFFSMDVLPRHTILNDLSHEITTLFRVLRTRAPELVHALEMTPWSRNEYEKSTEPTDDEVECARRFVVRCWQAHGSRMYGNSGWSRGGPGAKSPLKLWLTLPDRLLAVADRLKYAEIESRPALRLLQDPTYTAPRVLWYVDPPYLRATRRDRYYQYEMTDADHHEVLAALDAHPGYILLSGYPHPLYDEYLAHWGRTKTTATTQSGRRRQEVLWLNPRTMRVLSHQQLSFIEKEESTPMFPLGK